MANNNGYNLSFAVIYTEVFLAHSNSFAFDERNFILSA